MKYSKLVFIGFLMSFVIACSSDDDANATSTGDTFEISDDPFSGTIDDEDFILVTANGEITFEELEGEDPVEMLRFALSDTDFDCGILDTQRFPITATVITDQEGIQNTNIATVTATGVVNQALGLAEIVSINDTEAVIKIQTSGAELDANYELEGLFTVTICSVSQISVGQ